jgi:hypothetical protein
MSRAIWRWYRMWAKMLRWEVVMLLLCWVLMWGSWLQSKAPTRPMQTLHEHQSLFMLIKVKCIFDVHVKTTFVLTSIVQSNIWTLSNFKEILCIYVIKNMGQFTYSKCKVARLLWLAHVGMRICGCAQLLSCSHLMDHTRSPLVFHVNLIGQKYFWGNKMGHLLVNP